MVAKFFVVSDNLLVHGESHGPRSFFTSILNTNNWREWRNPKEVPHVAITFLVRTVPDTTPNANATAVGRSYDRNTKQYLPVRTVPYSTVLQMCGLRGVVEARVGSWYTRSLGRPK